MTECVRVAALAILAIIENMLTFASSQKINNYRLDSFPDKLAVLLLDLFSGWTVLVYSVQSPLAHSLSQIVQIC